MTSKKPAQERSRLTVRSILEASVQILMRTRKDGLNTRQVAERAGVSVGSLYQYFKGSDSILETLANEQIDRDIRNIRETFTRTPGSAEARLHAMFRRVIAEHRHNSPVRAVFFRKAFQLGISEMVLEKLEAISQEIFAELKTSLPLRPDLDEPLATHLLSRALFGIVQSVVMEAKELHDPEKYASEMTRMLVRYLT